MASLKGHKRQTLSERERAFCRAYFGKARGNGALSARLAGYSPKGADVRAAELLGRRRVQQELQRLRAMAVKAAVATNEEIDAVLTELLRHPDWRARVAAARELSRTRGRHSIKLRHEGTVTLEEAIAASRREKVVEGTVVDSKALPAAAEGQAE